MINRKIFAFLVALSLLMAATPALAEETPPRHRGHLHH